MSDAVQNLTLEQCARLLDGWTPALQLDVREQTARTALQLDQARAAVANRITRGELSLADLQKVAA